MSADDERRAYMAGEGAILQSDVGRTLAEAIATQVPSRLPEVDTDLFTGTYYLDRLSADPHHPVLGPAILPLFKLKKGLSGWVRQNFRLNEEESHVKINAARIGSLGCKIYKSDVERGKEHAKFAAGFDDPEFSIDFSSWSANAILKTFLDLEPERVKALADKVGLLDIADLISTGWFSDAMHGLAMGGFGTWNVTGQELHYFLGTVYSSKVEGPIFEVVAAPDQPEYFGYGGKLIGQPTRATKVSLRKAMREDGDSVGCPAARRGIILEKGQEETYHVRRLVELGHAAIKTIPGSEDSVVLHQEQTAIDHNLLAWAHYLRKYVGLYGEPRADMRGGMTHRPPTPSSLEEYFVI